MSAPIAFHQGRLARFRAEADAHERRSQGVSWARLALFVSGAICAATGFYRADAAYLGIAALLGVFFVIAVIAHALILGKRDRAIVRAEVHERHVQRLSDAWHGFASKGEGLLPPGHPYGPDLDVTGQGSLFQRIDTTHTVHGAKALAAWLATYADRSALARRQEAVRELADLGDFRAELEASARWAGEEKLDGHPFLDLRHVPSLFERRPWLLAVAAISSLSSLAVLALISAKGLPWFSLAPFLLLHIAINAATSGFMGRTLALITERRRFGEAFEGMMRTVEDAPFRAELLREIVSRMRGHGAPASRELARLDRWLGFAELRTAGILYVVINHLVLFDLFVLFGIERWVRDTSGRTASWFEGLGEIEALSSLAALFYGDPGATMPEIVDEPSAAFVAEGVAHPLIPNDKRVANDVALREPRTVLIVTGSNMAGKSTLLRSIGVNTALALAGGPVIAKKFSLPLVTLRASMRAEDDLEVGSSYFQAELAKLRVVVAEVQPDAPPILFLLDELLRGTNARARHIGAKAVLQHLLRRGGRGLIATHDIALSALEQEDPRHVANGHFTDIVRDGEMAFDYTLREGVVKTSNALALLRMAGIDVPEDDRADLAAPIS